MGIFSRNRSQHHPSGGSTIIAADTQLDGHLTLSDNLHIDGNVEGEIKSKGDVTIGGDGGFIGTIRARNVYVSGSLDGRVTAERLEIVGGGSVEGEIQVGDLVIEPGGRFNGSSTILGQPDVQPETVPCKQKKMMTEDGGLAEGSA